ncbi:MAG TPA: hypothetical protein PKC87_02990 [Candidatus Absconditabacterales bacterium]|nr:hypothetical protein [Candidatus Absconditabacterales bacterium]
MKKKLLLILIITGIILMGCGFFILNRYQIQKENVIKALPINNVVNINSADSSKKENINISEISMIKSESLPDDVMLKEIQEAQGKIRNVSSGPENICSNEKNNWDINNCQIKIGKSTEYRIQSNDSSEYILLKNNKKIWSKKLIFGAVDPITNVFVFKNLFIFSYVLWTDSSPENDVIINGESMREKYLFDSSYSPMIISNKLIFLGHTKDKVYVIVDGISNQINYEEVFHNGCCSMGGMNPIGNDQSMYFYAKRNGEWFWVTVNIN